MAVSVPKLWLKTMTSVVGLLRPCVRDESSYVSAIATHNCCRGPGKPGEACLNKYLSVLSYPVPSSALEKRAYISDNNAQLQSLPLISTTNSTLCQNKMQTCIRCTNTCSVCAVLVVQD